MNFSCDAPRQTANISLQQSGDPAFTKQASSPDEEQTLILVVNMNQKLGIQPFVGADYSYTVVRETILISTHRSKFAGH